MREVGERRRDYRSRSRLIGDMAELEAAFRAHVGCNSVTGFDAPFDAIATAGQSTPDPRRTNAPYQTACICAPAGLRMRLAMLATMR
jgi:hypothetical protein